MVARWKCKIRTIEMDENAEFGIASHWRYKKWSGDKYDDASTGSGA